MGALYRQLTQAQRYKICSLRATGHKLRPIAIKVGAHYSTNSRELPCNISPNEYDPELAHDQSNLRRCAAEKSTKILAKTNDIIAKGPGQTHERLLMI